MAAGKKMKWVDIREKLKRVKEKIALKRGKGPYKSIFLGFAPPAAAFLRREKNSSMVGDNDRNAQNTPLQYGL